LGVGEIHRRREGGYDNQGRRVKPMSIYAVVDINDLHDVIIPHFDAYPPWFRLEKYTAWRQRVESCDRASKGGEPDDE
jgi:hypothetical protein